MPIICSIVVSYFCLVTMFFWETIVLSETMHGTSLSGGCILGFCLIRVLLYTYEFHLEAPLLSGRGTGVVSISRFYLLGFNLYVDRCLGPAWVGLFTRLRSLPIELGLISYKNNYSPCY